MSTKAEILSIANELVLSRGYNAFSFADISQRLNIKKASIHYHFSTKSALGEELIKYHLELVKGLFDQYRAATPQERMQVFFGLYDVRKAARQVCIVGSLATDLYTVSPPVQSKIKELADTILKELIIILEDGKAAGVFAYESTPRAAALMIITSLMAGLQISRITADEDFETIKTTTLQNIIK